MSGAALPISSSTQAPHRPRRYQYVFLFLLLAICAAPAQTYLNATGMPTFLTGSNVENGFVNLGNGILHLEIPLATFPQRGKMALTAKLVYDSRMWQVVNNAWAPTNVANS
jgi:hypothetical protein